MQHCSVCHKSKELEAFRTKKDGTKNRMCSECIGYRQKRVLKVKELVDQYGGLFEIKCEICDKELDGRNRHRDHDRTTGQLRGVLCTWCNMGIGYFHDNAAILLKAHEYLIKSRPHMPQYIKPNGSTPMGRAVKAEALRVERARAIIESSGVTRKG